MENCRKTGAGVVAGPGAYLALSVAGANRVSPAAYRADVTGELRKVLEADVHELYLICDDVATEMKALEEKGVECTGVREERWGSLTQIPLPGGGHIGLYQSKHETALALRSDE